MEKVVSKPTVIPELGSYPNIVSVGKPPWSNRVHKGKFERLILQLGAGKGRFSEVEGIPRSIGCIGNNRFILRREPLNPERVRELVDEFNESKGSELWLTNYDHVEHMIAVASYAAEIGVPEVYAVVLLEDLERVKPVEGVRFVVEFEFSSSAFRILENFEWLYGALVMLRGAELDELMGLNTVFRGEVYADVLFPGSARKLDFNVIELRRILNPSVEAYHDCLAGTLAVTADGYALPCPLLRNYVVGDLKSMSLKKVLRKKRLREFWKMTKDKVDTCSMCPFKYICHDCRALEYQATGDILGLEYCPMRP